MLLTSSANVRRTPVPVFSIFASTLKGGIGYKGGLPWHLKKDLLNFTSFTRDKKPLSSATNAVIMGRNTFESLPSHSRPLNGRLNCVLTSGSFSNPNVLTANSLDDAIGKIQNRLGDNLGAIWVVGGAGVYDKVHREGLVDAIRWTRVVGSDVKTDVKLDIDSMLNNYEIDSISETIQDKGYSLDFVNLHKKGQNSEGRKICTENESSNGEYQYLKIMKDLIERGDSEDDRTGVGTLAKSGVMMRFDLENSFPLLTTKRVYWKGIVEELLWFLKGHTDAKLLAEKDVHIWDGNGSREFLDSRSLNHREVGDLGPVYGFQWRHFGAQYKDCHTDYSGQGVDQLTNLIHDIKTNPSSRRHILSAWNPAALSEMALPPCHILSQFFVNTKKGGLSCLLYQRSADWGLGIPFNIASYALLTIIIAHVRISSHIFLSFQLTNLKPKEFIHCVGNAHVYKNHVEPLKEQLLRAPRPFPQLKISKPFVKVEDLSFDHFELKNYSPYSSIKMEMAV